MAQNLEKEILLPTEQVIVNFRELRVNNQPGFFATVTNYRLLFLQTDVIHDIRLDAIAALSWGRLQLPFWVLIIGGFFVLVGIFILREVREALEAFIPGFLWLLIGGLMIALWFFYRWERLDIYTTGAKSFSVSGPKEALFELYRAIRQQGG
jgi:hypothetical protein